MAPRTPRLAPTLQWEDELHVQGARVVAGIDEVGKGSWAGPLVVGIAIVNSEKFAVEDLVARDSKILSEKKREELFDTVVAQCLDWSLGIVEASECDALGMSAAQRLATQRALALLTVKPDAVIADGKWDFVTPLVPRVMMQVKADAVSASVAAASVLAKVSRDRMMRNYAVQYQHWNFEGSKGYPCPKQRAGLREYGVSPLHRVSWVFMENLGLTK